MIPNDPQRAIRDATAAIAPQLVEIRRDIHRVPELAFQETRTAGIVAAELARLGIAHRTGLGITGVVGEITGGRPGPTLLIRADMDALPIHEEPASPTPAAPTGRCTPAATTSTPPHFWVSPPC